MTESKHCGDSSPHRRHDYTSSGVKDGKIQVITYTCPGNPMPGTERRKRK